MLITEAITINGTQFTRNYSDAGYVILQTDTGIRYSEAIDPADNPLNHIYEETDELIDKPVSEAAAFEQAGRILLGQED
jgi:hypothetical protein